jgi:hypothetical protein
MIYSLAMTKKLSKQFGYGFLLNILTKSQADAIDANTFVYSNQIHMLETWNHIAIKPDKIWGTHDWYQGPKYNNQVAELTQACDIVGIAQAITIYGRKKFLEQWKLKILSHQIMQILTS